MTGDNLALLEQARSLDKDALAAIYDLYSPGLFRYAWRLLGDTCLAEDCVAESFGRFLQALAKNKGPKDHLQAYLFRIAHNWITDYYRSKSNSNSVSVEDEVTLVVQEPDLQADVIEKQRVRQALFQLTSDQRQVVTLKFLEGWENEAIAATMNKPVGAVKALQHRALEALRHFLGVDKDELK